MSTAYEVVSTKLDDIEAEMKNIGYWQDAPLKTEQYDFRAAFAMDTMAFSQWIQFIFIPLVRNIIIEKGQFPSNSAVGTQAVREFDGDDNAAQLVSLLSEFDALFV
jgi:uncharacterized protein YqcC (DUF446 family)